MVTMEEAVFESVGKWFKFKNRKACREEILGKLGVYPKILSRGPPIGIFSKADKTSLL